MTKIMENPKTTATNPEKFRKSWKPWKMVNNDKNDKTKDKYQEKSL